MDVCRYFPVLYVIGAISVLISVLIGGFRCFPVFVGTSVPVLFRLYKKYDTEHKERDDTERTDRHTFTYIGADG